VILQDDTQVRNTATKNGQRSIGDQSNYDNQIMNTDFWKKAINKEMAKAKIAWATHNGHTPQQIREGKVAAFIGFQEIRCHIVFVVAIVSSGW
jgi:hypothetical protein